jgi:hypothetical protein
MKGRAVFQGNDVRDQNWDAAMFQELSSCPATMEAAKAADAYGLAPGHTLEQADAEQAYTQSRLGGTPTWVRLPPEARPAAWAEYRDPVCPLVLALYGHPDSGGFWERHCDEALKKHGFQTIDAWQSCYWHPTLRLSLVVYVDDFKLSGPTASVAEGWHLIRSLLRVGDPEPAGLYLGCRHILRSMPSPTSGKPVRALEYDMSDFLKACVDRFIELTGVSSLRDAPTPFIDVADTTAPSVGKFIPEGYDPGVGIPDAPVTPGKWGAIASRVLMKVLYAARMATWPDQTFSKLSTVSHA